MHLKELFSAGDLIVDFDPVDKWDAIRRLVDHLVQDGGIAKEAVDAVLEAVLSRERSMSTGMEHGISIPHAAVDEVTEVVACMGIVRRAEGLAFESIDGQPTRLVVLLIIPRSQKLLHIRTLADVARVLAMEPVRQALLAANDAAGAHAALVEGESAPSS